MALLSALSKLCQGLCLRVLVQCDKALKLMEQEAALNPLLLPLMLPDTRKKEGRKKVQIVRRYVTLRSCTFLDTVMVV